MEEKVSRYFNYKPVQAGRREKYVSVSHSTRAHCFLYISVFFFYPFRQGTISTIQFIKALSLFSCLLSSSSRALSQPRTLRVTFMLTFSPGLIPRAYFYKDSWHQFKRDNLRSSNPISLIYLKFDGKKIKVKKMKKVKVKRI